MMADDNMLQRLLIQGQLVSKPNPTHRLVCCPWAGGGAAYFLRWDTCFTPDIQVLGVRLPGRETRLNEQAYDTIHQVALDLAACIHTHYRDTPFSLYGHSLGARVAFETALVLARSYSLQPQHLFVSGSYAPQETKGRDLFLSQIPENPDDGQLVEYLKRTGGTPSAVLSNPELLRLVLPPLRADLGLLRKYSYCPETKNPPLSCPLVAMDGTEDIDHSLSEWQKVTTGSFTQRKFAGGHFFLLDNERQIQLADFITSQLELDDATGAV